MDARKIVPTVAVLEIRQPDSEDWSPYTFYFYFCIFYFFNFLFFKFFAMF